MMKSITFKIALLAVVMFAAGCSSTEAVTKAAGSNAEYEAALANAQAAVKKAASVGGEWRDIRWKKSKKKYLPNAIKAAEAGDYAKAMKLLSIAQFQAEAGYKQAMAQKNAGPRF